MSGQPLVSICIPAYNSEKYILETVEHALNQTWKNIEVLVVDDASTDGTVEKLKTIQDPRFHYYVNEKNLGMTGNWNRCVCLCKGEYVKLVPADDLLYPGCIAKSAPYLIRHPDVTLVITGTDLINDEGRITGRYAHWPVRGVFRGDKLAKSSILLNNFFGNPVCALFRKEDFELTGGFDEDIPYILDFDLWLSLACLGNVAVEPESYNAFRVRTDSNTGRLTGNGGASYTKEHIRLMNKQMHWGHLHLSPAEQLFSVSWRWLRNWIIAAYIRISNR
jgi:glycosyltransferase involved in cell wall biosynthesis